MKRKLKILGVSGIFGLMMVAFLPASQAASDLIAADRPDLSTVATQKPEITYGKIQSIPASEVFGTYAARSASASVRCNQQNVTMSYPELRFTGTKEWCYDGTRVTQGTMEVSTFIQAEHRYTQNRDGWVYVPGALKSSDGFVTINGVTRAAHKSVRTGRFEYRVNGQTKPQAVYIPSVNRTSYGDGDCRGPKPVDLAPRIIALAPSPAQTGVVRANNIVAQLNIEAKIGTSNEGTFYVINNRTGEYVAGRTGRYVPDPTMIIIDPDKPLDPNTSYTATIAAGPNGVLSETGDPLQTGRTWSFRTGTQ